MSLDKGFDEMGFCVVEFMNRSNKTNVYTVFIFASHKCVCVCVVWHYRLKELSMCWWNIVFVSLFNLKKKEFSHKSVKY